MKCSENVPCAYQKIWPQSLGLRFDQVSRSGLNELRAGVGRGQAGNILCNPIIFGRSKSFSILSLKIGFYELSSEAELDQSHFIHVLEVRGTRASYLIMSCSSINCVDIKI